MTNNESRSVSVIDTATREVVGQLPVGNLPEAVVVAPDDSRVLWPTGDRVHVRPLTRD